jgi:hypothetical protein
MALHKLIFAASPALSSDNATTDAASRALQPLLKLRNGFYAFEQALLVRPLHGESPELGIAEWNVPALWKTNYRGVAPSLAAITFFAEDIFGHPFGIDGRGRVSSFEPETGELTEIAATLDAWAALVLADFNFWTGYELAHQWQKHNGTLPPGQRLLPTTPFVMGGEFAIDNLVATPVLDAMRWRSDLARQIKDMPDGTEVSMDT